MAEFLAAGEACKSLYSDLLQAKQRKTFNGSEFSAERTFISTSAVAHGRFPRVNEMKILPVQTGWP